MKLPQIIVLILAIAIGAILYFTPMAPIAEKANAEEHAHDQPVAKYAILDDVTEVKNGLDSAALANINRWESEAAFDSMVVFYDMLRQPVAAAYYAQKNAEKVNSANAWTEAGERYLLTAKYIGNQQQKVAWFTEAKSAFEKAIELDPTDLDIQVDLGVCMIESATVLGTPPMEGIGKLKSVEQQDPNNIKALINLGYFAIKSGQFEKAEERFDQVIAVDENYADVYLYKADLNERQKKYTEAISDLEKYKSLVQDPQRIEEVDKYIEELSNNI